MRPFKSFLVAIRAQLHDEAFRATLVLLIGLLATGTLIYPVLEGWSLVDSLYVSVVTLATVGYGDIHPVTDLGKLFTVVYILTGVGVLVVFASRVVNTMVTTRSEGIRHREERFRERHPSAHSHTTDPADPSIDPPADPGVDPHPDLARGAPPG
jgi:hypothetical protein